MDYIDLVMHGKYIAYGLTLSGVVVSALIAVLVNMSSHLKTLVEDIAIIKDKKHELETSQQVCLDNIRRVDILEINYAVLLEKIDVIYKKSLSDIKESGKLIRQDNI